MDRGSEFSPWSAMNKDISPNKPIQDNVTCFQGRTVSPVGCRSSANNVIAVMSKFNQQKKDLVRSIGFGGLLELHEISRVNRFFSHWLVSKTKWEDGTLNINEGVKMKIVAQDIEKIIGIPSTGKDILAYCIKEEDKTTFLEKHMPFLGPEHSLLKVADSIVQRVLPLNMSNQDADQFKIAFVILVMGRFLAPTKQFYTGNYNFWHALINPDKIKYFNWSDYVLSCLLESARVVFFANILGTEVPTITGCPLLLQIFYLDNIDLGHLNMRHDVFPRIKAYDCSILARMIQADTNNDSGAFGCSKLRCRTESCYSLPEISEAPIANNISPPGRTVVSPSHKKRAFVSMSGSTRSITSTDGALFGSSPIISRSGTADFPAYIRSKYPDHVKNSFMEALRYHNARCIQQINNSKNALTAAIVAENMALADKFIEQHCHQMGSGVPKVPRKVSRNKRRTYEDLLSGPESGSEAEGQNPRSRGKKKDGSYMDITAQLVSPINTVEQAGPPTKHGTTTTTAQPEFPNIQTTQAQLHVQSPSGKELDTTPSGKELDSTIFNLYTANSQDVNVVCSQYNVQDIYDSTFHTPDPVSRMAPLSPEISPTTKNKVQSERAVSLRMLSSLVTMDLNTIPIDAQYNNSPITKKIVKVGRFAKSHWALGADHPVRDTSVTGTLFDWFATTRSDELDRSWIIHETPRYIECKGHELQNQIFAGTGISYDLFDIFVRRLQQLDKLIYAEDIPLRWRHMFESDFSMHALGNEKPAAVKCIRDQLIGPAIDYEIHRCRMLFVPVQVREVWWCYAIDLKQHKVFIIEPTADGNDQASVLRKHFGTIKILLQSLESTISTLFDGWDLTFDVFENIVVTTSTSSGCHRSDSAFYTLYCMKNFDGDSNIQTTPLIIQKFKHYMVYELFALRDNKGTLPSVYVQTIDD